MLRRHPILSFATVVLIVLGVIVWAKDQPRPSTGDYNLSVAGFAKGTGTATVAGTSLSLQATIVSEKGEKGQLSASGLTIDKNHFKGTGTVLGQSATFKGRLDVPDSVDETAIKGVRLVCTVATADGRYLRLAGFIPAQAQAPDPVDDDPEHEHHDRSRGAGLGPQPNGDDHRD
jgi:hypothetical protein